MSSTITPIGLQGTNTAWQVQTKDADKLGSLRSLFVSKERNAGQLETAKNSFLEAYQSQVQHVADQLPSGAVESFKKKADTALQNILQNSFEKTQQDVQGGGQYNKKVHRKLVKTANELAVQTFKQIEKEMLLDKQFLKEVGRQVHGQGQEVPLRPKVLIRNGEICVQRRPPMVETLVLRGGGAKGIANIPAMRQLEKTGGLKEVRHVVGTSAGALTAMTMACGYDAKRLDQLMKDHPMKELSGTVKNFKEIYPMVELEGIAGRKNNVLGGIVRWKGGGSGQEALRVADMASAKRVSSYLQENWDKPEFQVKLEQIKNKHGSEVAGRLEMLKQNPDFESDRTGKMVTFNDLKVLSEIDPQTFKELTLTGYDRTYGRTNYFSAEKHGNMPVAIAGRISMSIPVIFQSVKFDPKDGGGQREWVDGGVGSNMPSEVVMRDKKGKELEPGLAKEMLQAKTMLFTYAENDKWEKKLHGPQNESGGVMDWLKAKVKGLFSGNSNFQQVGRDDSRKIYEGGLNTFVVHHHDIDTMSLNASDQEVQLAQAKSTLMTLKHIELRQEQVFEQTMNDVAEVLPYLSEMEKMAIVDGGPPSPDRFPGGVDDVEYSLELRLYNLVAEEMGIDTNEMGQESGLKLESGGGYGRGGSNEIDIEGGTSTIPRNRLSFDDGFLQPGDEINLDTMTINRPPGEQKSTSSGPKIEEVD